MKIKLVAVKCKARDFRRALAAALARIKN